MTDRDERAREIGRLTGELVLTIGALDVIIRRLAALDVSATLTNRPASGSQIRVGEYAGPIRLDMFSHSPPDDPRNPAVQP